MDEIHPEYLKSLDVVGTVLADTSLQHRVAVGDSTSGMADRYGGPSLQEGGPEGVFQLQGDHTSQPPREGLCQGTGKENTADSRTSDSGGTVWFLSRPWNTGPALYPL